MGVDIVIPALIQFTQRNDLARATGAYALSQIESPKAETAVLEVLPRLVDALGSDDRKVATATLVALNGIGASAVFALLGKMSEEEQTVRQRAAQALEQMGQPA